MQIPDIIWARPKGMSGWDWLAAREKAWVGLTDAQRAFVADEEERREREHQAELARMMREEAEARWRVERQDHLRHVPPEYATATLGNIRDKRARARIQAWWQTTQNTRAGLRPLLILSGKPGRGKSWALWALYQQAVEAGPPFPDFWKCSRAGQKMLDELFDDDIRRYRRATLQQRLSSMGGLLLLDDLGWQKAGGKGWELLAQVIDERLEAWRPVAIATNYAGSHDIAAFDERLASRLKLGTVVRFRGEDLRG